eukprot:Clim_evm15s47 gene=Clim_evmTU15s47
MAEYFPPGLYSEQGLDYDTDSSVEDVEQTQGTGVKLSKAERLRRSALRSELRQSVSIAESKDNPIPKNLPLILCIGPDACAAVTDFLGESKVVGSVVYPSTKNVEAGKRSALAYSSKQVVPVDCIVSDGKSFVQANFGASEHATEADGLVAQALFDTVSPSKVVTVLFKRASYDGVSRISAVTTAGTSAGSLPSQSALIKGLAASLMALAFSKGVDGIAFTYGVDHANVSGSEFESDMSRVQTALSSFCGVEVRTKTLTSKSDPGARQGPIYS